ncbi:unnamed protein product [Mytilus coruscus]|uniref:Uncharacterized protein n=1 Tax=Mytilus coruscus TaxID=42192 RepID=A0A6J8DDT8_MYTCO|nr:unnamed protein product [Mytilus coruscus]
MAQSQPLLPETTHEHKMTEKGKELYDTHKVKYLKRIDGSWEIVENLLEEFTDCSKELKPLRKLEKKHFEFLTRKNTEDSNETLSTFKTEFKKCTEIIDNTIQQIKTLKLTAAETMSVAPVKSVRSNNSGRSGSISSSVMAQKRVNAEVQRTKLQYAEQQTRLIKQKAISKALRDREEAEVDADLALLKQQTDTAVAEAEVKVLEEAESDKRSLSLQDDKDPLEKVKMTLTEKYANEQFKEVEQLKSQDKNNNVPQVIPNNQDNFSSHTPAPRNQFNINPTPRNLPKFEVDNFDRSIAEDIKPEIRQKQTLNPCAADFEFTQSPLPPKHDQSTNVMNNGRGTIFEPCINTLYVKENTELAHIRDNVHSQRYNNDPLFIKTQDDDKIGTSVEDRLFLNLMDSEFKKDSNGHWTAPLPFRPNRQRLPNNSSQAWKRAQILDKSIQQNLTKKTHFVEFMQKVLVSGAAEVAPAITDEESDCGTRYSIYVDMENNPWLLGPKWMNNSDEEAQCDVKTLYPLVSPDNGKETRTEISASKTSINALAPVVGRFEKFSSWRRLVKAISFLQHVAQSFSLKNKSCQGWHFCQNVMSVDSYKKAELFILKECQKEVYSQEIECLAGGTRISKQSSLISLSPFLDSQGLIRVGGRLEKTKSWLPTGEINPIIVPKNSYIIKPSLNPVDCTKNRYTCKDNLVKVNTND